MDAGKGTLGFKTFAALQPAPGNPGNSAEIPVAPTA
jgi:hypothetical protein